MRLVPYKKDMRYLKLGKQFSAYDIVSEEQTEAVMQTFAKNRWAFPMTLYFESYPDEKDAILNTPLPVKEMLSIKKILHFSAKVFQRERIPAFVLQIDNETMLEQALEEFFYVSEQNFLFALTNEQRLIFEGEHLSTNSDKTEILIVDYDGQAAIFITSRREDFLCEK
ncbi:hypothetical protein MKZ25_10335 [Solibacillus sp. FSL W7-1464]|uniref:hypothetical protein n=1 Tax=Solibacillus sp. FSL W7-1464 TaxID=2921706 RepID=UPI0030F834B7